MALTTDDVPVDKPREEPSPGRAGGLLSTRKSRALLQEILEALEVEQKVIPAPKQELAVHRLETALREAQGKAKNPSGQRPSDEAVGKPCPACKSEIRGEDLVIARADGIEVHVRCVAGA
jgi:hypothetical protein